MSEPQPPSRPRPAEPDLDVSAIENAVGADHRVIMQRRHKGCGGTIIREVVTGPHEFPHRPRKYRDRCDRCKKQVEYRPVVREVEVTL